MKDLQIKSRLYKLLRSHDYNHWNFNDAIFSKTLSLIEEIEEVTVMLKVRDNTDKAAVKLLKTIRNSVNINIVNLNHRQLELTNSEKMLLWRIECLLKEFVHEVDLLDTNVRPTGGKFYVINNCGESRELRLKESIMYVLFRKIPDKV